MDTKHVIQFYDLFDEDSRLQNRKSKKVEFLTTTKILETLDETYDAVLCLGPLYHLVDVQNQEKCISECLRVLKPGGLAAFAYISRLQVFPYVVQGDRRYLKEEWIDRILDRGSTYANEEESFWTDAYYHLPEELEKRLGAYPIEIIDHAASDGIAPLMGSFVDQLNDHEYEIWMKYHIRTCREPSIIGMSNHGLIICKKNDL